MPKGERIATVLILLFYAGCAVAFSLEPIFEAPDEREHYEYIHTLAHDHAFPDPTAPLKEFHQPPLYYLLAAPLVMILGDSDFDTVASRLNPYRFIHAETGWYQLGNDNKNFYLHTRAERFPYANSQTARAAHLLRLISVVLGLVTLLISARIFRLAWPDRPSLRLFALCILATWPQFVYGMSAISNDVLLIMLATLALWLGLRVQRDGPSRQLVLALGITLGLALLTKFSALVVAAVVSLPLVINRRGWRDIPLVAFPVLTIAGWWYVRNAWVYSDPTGLEAMYKAWPDLRIPNSVTFGERLDRVPFIYSSFWALLGTSTIAVHRELYIFYDAVTVLALGGCGLRICQEQRARCAVGEESVSNPEPTIPSGKHPARGAMGLCVLLALALGGATIAYTFQNYAGNQGRFLFPGIAAWGMLLALGLSAWIPARWQRFVISMGVVAFGSAAVLSVHDVHRAYAIPAAPDRFAYPVHYSFEGYAELLGVGEPTVRARPGDLVTITLYWRALRPSEESELLVYVHSVGSQVIRRDTYPATGNLIATDWLAGAAWTEHHIIRVPRDAEQGRVYPLVAGFYDPEAGRALTATNANGDEVTPVIGRVAINAPPRQIDPAYHFADLIALASPQITQDGEQLTMCLSWRAERQVPVDLALFVHLLDGAGNLITQHDGPAGGEYPTGVWARGEVVDQCVVLTAPDVPDDAQIAFGLYRMDDFTRLAVHDASGHALGDMAQIGASPAGQR